MAVVPYAETGYDACQECGAPMLDLSCCINGCHAFIPTPDGDDCVNCLRELDALPPLAPSEIPL